MRVLLVCDRSGGHVFPALALGKRIKECSPDTKVSFFTTAVFLKEYLTREGFSVSGKVFPSRNLIIEGVFRFLEALFIIARHCPQKIIGFGGRDSFFLVLFGSLFLCETYIYEPNVSMGRANKVLSLFAGKILIGFPSIESSSRIQAVGIPLRNTIRAIDKACARKELGLTDAPVILCFGGSQGSSFLNSTCLRLVREIKEDFQIIHLTGKREYFQIAQFYNTIGKARFVRDFYYSMEVLYSAADAVISRCGASALAEIAYYKLPALLVPYPAAGGHQEANAAYFRKHGAAFMFTQDNFSFDEFAEVFTQILFNAQLRKRLSENLEKMNVEVDIDKFYQAVCG